MITYAYDRENRLRETTAPDASKTTMLYGGDGLRRVKRYASSTVTTIWDGGEYLMEKD